MAPSQMLHLSDKGCDILLDEGMKGRSTDYVVEQLDDLAKKEDIWRLPKDLNTKPEGKQQKAKKDFVTRCLNVFCRADGDVAMDWYLGSGGLGCTGSCTLNGLAFRSMEAASMRRYNQNELLYFFSELSYTDLKKLGSRLEIRKHLIRLFLAGENKQIDLDSFTPVQIATLSVKHFLSTSQEGEIPAPPAAAAAAPADDEDEDEDSKKMPAVVDLTHDDSAVKEEPNDPEEEEEDRKPPATNRAARSAEQKAAEEEVARSETALLMEYHALRKDILQKRNLRDVYRKEQGLSDEIDNEIPGRPSEDVEADNKQLKRLLKKAKREVDILVEDEDE